MKTKRVKVLKTLLLACASMATLILLPGQASAAEQEYTIKKGDTLWDISMAYNTTPEDLAWYNNIDINNFIFPDQILIIPNLQAVENSAIPVLEQPEYTVPALEQHIQTTYEYEFLAAIVQQEAGYNYDSAVAVTSTIMNRVNDGRFGNGITGVLTQPGQFQAYGAGHYQKHMGNITQDTYNAVNYVLNNGSTHNYLFFWGASYASMMGQNGVNIGGNVYFN